MTVEDKQEIVDILLEHEEDIRSLGVQRVALFGSFVRNQGGPNSDVDLIVEFAPALKTFANFIALCHLLETLMGRKVEVITKEALSPYIGPHILREAEYVPFGA